MEIDILFADVDESLRDLYQSYFFRKGLTVQTVTDGWECAAAAREHRPCFLIIDIEMFAQEGEAAALLNDPGVVRSVPVVIVTGDELPGRLSEMTGVLRSRCFRKPYSFMALLECMCAASSRATVSPQHEMEALSNLVGQHAGPDDKSSSEVSLR